MKPQHGVIKSSAHTASSSPVPFCPMPLPVLPSAAALPAAPCTHRYPLCGLSVSPSACVSYLESPLSRAPLPVLPSYGQLLRS